MGVKITISNKLTRLLKSSESRGLIKEVRKEFAKKGPIKVKQAINQDMIRGISPVDGKGKWKKYSDSYKEEIRQGKSKKMKGAKPSKRINPANLRLSGELHNSLSTYVRGKTFFIKFSHFLADIHNRRGASKKKVIRRMLPTKKGEKFNRTIESTFLGELKKAVDKVAKSFLGK